jgi:disulfide bond formation protein DsbB
MKDGGEMNADGQAGAGASHDTGWLMLFAAWAVALVATLGAIFAGEIMGQTPCLLCWYQRIFMFPLAVLLGVAGFRGDGGAFYYGLPLAVMGALVAAYHCLLYADILTEAMRPCTQNGPSCTDAAMNLAGLPLPYLSLAAFAAIIILLFTSRRTRT